MTQTTLLVAESDSRWVEWARASRTPQHQLVLVVQHAEESQSAFFCRVKQRLERLLHGAEWLCRVVLIAGSRWDAPALFARAQMIRGVLARSVRRALAPQLWLDAGARQGPAHIGVTAIAEALQRSAAGMAEQPWLVFGPIAIGREAA